MSSRPKSNDVYKKQGFKEKEKEKARSGSSPKDEIEKARDLLKKEVLRTANGNLRRAFDTFGEGVDIQFLLSFVGMEMVRLQQSLEDGESPDYRYTSAMNKYIDQLRRLLMIREGSASFIPENISVQLTGEGADGEDESDRPEFT
jgi:hypothetical protein